MTGRLTRAAPMLVSAAVLLAAAVDAAVADPPLHTRIDQMVGDSLALPPSGRSTDEAFLRRVYLDLAGTIPDSAEAREFLGDATPEKRAVLIDRLLGSLMYVRQMANIFDVMLMERRAEKHVPQAEWQEYLRASFAQNKPFDQLVREILSADGTDERIRAAAKFYLDREVEPHAMTRDVGRIFFGQDLQCAQCHDHPHIDDYYQADYHGLFAFLSRSSLFTDKDKKVFVADKAEGDVKFKSVFTGEEGQTVPRLPGDDTIDEPAIAKEELYVVAPAKGVRPVPKYSRRMRLAEEVATGKNVAFNRNIVNRLWAHMMGQGLVEPVDMHHADNPPAHARLLDWLADEFAAMKFDVKAFLRELALSETYQRSGELPGNLDEYAATASDMLASLEEDRSRCAAQVEQADSQLEEAIVERKAAAETADQLGAEKNQAVASVVEAEKEAGEAATALGDAQKQLVDQQEILTALSKVAEAARQVAAKLATDQPLGEAVAAFQQRTEQAVVQTGELVRQVEALSAAAQSANETVTSLRNAASEVQARLSAAQERLAECSQRLDERNAQRQAATNALVRAEHRVEDTERLIEYREQWRGAVATREEYDQRRLQLQESQAGQMETTVSLAKVRDELAAVQQAKTDVETAMEQARSQLAVKEPVQVTVAQLVAKAEGVRNVLASDAGVAAAFVAVASRPAELAAELDQLRGQLSTRQQDAVRAAARLETHNASITELSARLSQLNDTLPGLEAAVTEAQQRLAAADGAAGTASDELNARLARRSAARGIRPLDPSQLAFSVMQAAGVVDQQRAAAEAELEKAEAEAQKKAEEESPEAKSAGEPLGPAERAAKIEQALFEKLSGNVKTFVKLFGAGAGQPQNAFFATADQALFFANSGSVQGWLAPGSGNLTGRLAAIDDPRSLCQELYLSVLTREPTEEEIKTVAEYLAARPEKKTAAVQEMAWALISSVEFRFSR